MQEQRTSFIKPGAEAGGDVFVQGAGKGKVRVDCGAAADFGSGVVQVGFGAGHGRVHGMVVGESHPKPSAPDRITNSPSRPTHYVVTPSKAVISRMSSVS
jgi:hypothetical protein